MRYDIDVVALERAILIWEELINSYKNNMDRVKRDHKFTWMFRAEYWKNERYCHRSFAALIQRRIKLQTALKNQKES